MHKYWITFIIFIACFLFSGMEARADSTGKRATIHVGVGLRYYAGSRNYFLPTNYSPTIGDKFPQLFKYYFNPWCPSVLVSRRTKKELMYISVYGNKISEGHFVGASLSYLVPVYKGIYIGGTTNHSSGVRRNIITVVDNVQYTFSHHEREYLSAGIELACLFKVSKVGIQISASTYYFEYRRFTIHRGNLLRNEIFDHALIYSPWFQPFFRNINLGAHVTF